MAAGAGADVAAGSRRVAGVPALGPGCAGRAGQQEAAERRAAGHQLRRRRGCGWSSTACRSGAATTSPIKQLVDDFARYLYLPRLEEPAVLLGAIRDGLALLTWEQDTFAYRRQLRRGCGPLPRACAAGRRSPADAERAGLLVKPIVARRQLDAEHAADRRWSDAGRACRRHRRIDRRRARHAVARCAHRTVAVQPKRFHGSVTLDPTRVGRDASRIADEVIAHLAGLVGAKVKVTLEIEARDPGPVRPTTSCVRSPRTAGR